MCRSYQIIQRFANQNQNLLVYAFFSLLFTRLTVSSLIFSKVDQKSFTSRRVIKQVARTKCGMTADILSDGGSGHGDEVREAATKDAAAYNHIFACSVDIGSGYIRNEILTITRSVRDVDNNSKRIFVYNMPISQPEMAMYATPYERNKNIQFVIPSPSGNKIAIFVEEGEPKRTILEIWCNRGASLKRRIPLEQKIHGKIYYDSSFFGGVAWRPEEDALVYVAERSVPELKSFFEPSTKDSIVGGQHTLGIGKKEDWGEKFVGVADSKLFLVSTETGRVACVDNVPGEGYALGQPVFAPCGKSIVYTGWDAGAGGNMPRRLGSIYCYQRPSKLYSSSVQNLLSVIQQDQNLDKEHLSVHDNSFQCLTPHDTLARSPRFENRQTTTDTKPLKLAFLYNTPGYETHSGVMGLSLLEWDMQESKSLLNTRKNIIKPLQIPSDSGGTFHGIKFPGLFLDSLPTNCFTSDGEFILLDSLWGSVTRILKISTKDGLFTTIDHPCSTESQRLLCLSSSDEAFVLLSLPNTPAKLYRWSIYNINDKTIFHEFHPIAISCVHSSDNSEPPIEGLKHDLIHVKAEDGSTFQAIMYRPNDTDTNLPLIVVPHGGPHSCLTTSFIASYSFLCAQGGYALLLVNYRGSTGFGQQSLESLAGVVGKQDVKDVVDATKHALDCFQDFIDSERVGICGGSHGGFLAGHLIGQYPSIFKVAAMRNPVTNIASMVTATDIPDWCYIETFGLGSYDWTRFHAPNAEQLIAMWNASPVSHIQMVRAPTLVALGMSDRRVPPSQGTEFYYALRSKGVPTKLLTYENNDHAIDKPAAESDHWINIKLWFDRYLK